MKIVVVTPIWKRYRLTRFVLQQWASWDVPGIEFEFVVVGSELGNSGLVFAEGFSHPDDRARAHYVEYDNSPLGAKFNRGIAECRKLNFDYIMIMGSDQMASDELFEAYRPFFGEPYIGVLDTFVFDIETWSCFYWPGYQDHRAGEAIGPGRLVHRKEAERLNYAFYDPERNRNLDQSMNWNLPQPVVFTAKQYGMVGFKTPDSITPAHRYKGITAIDTYAFNTTFYPELDFSVLR